MKENSRFLWLLMLLQEVLIFLKLSWLSNLIHQKIPRATSTEAEELLELEGQELASPFTTIEVENSLIELKT